MLSKLKRRLKTVYLDNAATTYVDARVVKVMRPFWQEKYGNPSSIHKPGQAAKAALAQARLSIAGALSAKPSEIVFTAGGTESINLAIFGPARQYELTHKRKGHLITTAIEHEAVLKSMEALGEEGWQITEVPVDKLGGVKLEAIKKALRPDTVLVSVMAANNEIGTLQPLAQIAKILRSTKAGERPLFHTDACQAAGVIEMNVHKLGVDLLSANGSKIYGPKQTGFLYVRSGVVLRPVLFGGGQEKNLRSGTENVAGYVGLAKAFELAQKGRVAENHRLAVLRDYFIKQVEKSIPRANLNGPRDERLPNNINFSFDGVDGEALLLYLDSYNIAVSTGSACTEQTSDPSHVILATGGTKKRAQSSIRFSLGRQITKKDLDYTLKVLESLVKELRRVGK